MTIAQRMKAADKQAVCKKLVTQLKKTYKGSVPKSDRPILETMLFGVCLENSTRDAATAAYDRLHDEFHDLNEIRVSSITELERVLHGLPDPEWKAMRIRSVLHHIFEKQFSYDFEILRRKTHDLAGKQLAKIDNLSHFVRNYTLQTALGSHVLPFDDLMTKAVCWFGLADVGSSPEEASEAVKPALRKNDAPLFCHLLRQFATDARFMKAVESRLKKPPEEGFDPTTAVERLTDLMKNPTARPKKKAAAKKTSAKKSTTTRKKTKSPAQKTATKRAATKGKKTAARKKTTTKKRSTKTGKSKASR